MGSDKFSPSGRVPPVGQPVGRSIDRQPSTGPSKTPTTKRYLEVQVSSLSEIIQTARSWVDEKDLILWYRGQANANWSLGPAIYRESLMDKERHLVYEFYVRAPSRHLRCPVHDDYAGWLSLMQHYGLPTRLLDWTTSPLVAAHFATQSNGGNSDASIWSITPGTLNEALGFEPVIHTLDSKVAIELLRPAFGRGATASGILAAMPVEIDARMQVQQGAFTIHASPTPLDETSGNEAWLRRMKIPQKAKADIARDLLVAGFRLGDLFPDLGNLAKELKERFVAKR